MKWEASEIDTNDEYQKTEGEPLRGWSKADFQGHCASLAGLIDELRKSGEFVAAEGLALPGRAKLVTAGKDGAPITDGVFPESKEFLASYSIIDVNSPERAYAIAARASAAPGPSGLPLNMPIEVLEILSGPPVDLS